MFGLTLGVNLSAGGGPSFVNPLLSMTDVSLWVRSDKSMTVSQWTDQSPKANNLTQSTGGSQPTINASDADFNGRPSLVFNGTTAFMTITSFTLGSGADSFIWMVMKLTAAGSFPIFWTENGQRELRGHASAGQPELTNANIASTATWASSIVGSTKAVYGFDQGAGTLGVDVSNGTAVTQANSAHTGTTFSPVFVGSRNGTLFAAMKVAEIVVCNTMPSAGTLAALQAYAVGLYGAV